jgi:hypothetical protein
LAFPAARQERHRLRFEELRGDVRKIVGTVLLENNRENILELRIDANRLRQ